MDPRKRQQFFPSTTVTLFFITENERVYCAVRTKYSNIIQLNLVLKGLNIWAVVIVTSIRAAA